MSNSLLNTLVVKLTDWLIALCGACFLMWFVVTQPVLSGRTENNLPLIEFNNIQAHVKSLKYGFASGTLEHENLNYKAAYISKQFDGLGKVEYQRVSSLAGNYNNIILNLGRDTKEIFVIGIHYNLKDDASDKADNSTGIATLIELARKLSNAADSLRIRVVLVAYPLLKSQSISIKNAGSYQHAVSLRNSSKNVRLMISLDNVGQFNNIKSDQKQPYKFLRLLHPDKDKSINLTGRLSDFSEIRHLKKSFSNATVLPLYSLNLPVSFSKTGSSDHNHYWQQGFPAVLISDTAKYPMSDKRQEIIQRFDYMKMAMLVQGLYQAVMDTVADSRETYIVQKKRDSETDLILH
jgi:hypothetical protein